MKSVIVLLLLVFVVFVMLTFTHEKLHGVVCEYVGGRSFNTFSFKSFSFSSCIVPVGGFSVVLSDYDRFNLVNEFIGYNSSLLLLFLFVYPVYIKVLGGK